MPTIISHPAIVVPLASWFRRLPHIVVIAAAIGTVIPDADVAAFAVGIPYGHPLGHRGFSHSLLFAALFAAASAFVARRVTPEVSVRLAWSVVFLATASHGLLDAMTNGGLGVGFFIPFSNERFFLPATPIRVSPIGVGRFAEKAGVVLASEARWVWLPCFVIAAAGILARRK